MTDIAIAHDQFRTMGGAERVACEIARLYDCPIYAMRVDEDVPPDDVDVRSLETDVGGWLMRRHHLLQDVYQMFAWQHIDDLYDFDTIIQTKTNPYWFVPKDTQTVVRYVHSTPRNMYDQFHRRGGHWFTDGMMTVQRLLYQHTINYADAWVANSDLVNRRLNRYFDVDPSEAHTIYPPVPVTEYSPDAAETGEYLFYVGRLAVNKRIPLIRDVAKAIECPVVVAGTGPQEDVLQADVPENLEYLGYISEDEKQRRLSEASATLMLAENEDFGITPIESMAAGTPVIGTNEGFTRFQIQHGQNGLLAEPDVDSVASVVAQLFEDGVEWSPEKIARFADQFGRERFHEEFRDVVEDAQQASRIEPQLTGEPEEVLYATD